MEFGANICTVKSQGEIKCTINLDTSSKKSLLLAYQNLYYFTEVRGFYHPFGHNST